MHHKEPTTLGVKIRIVLIFLILLVISWNTQAQQHKLSSTGKYVIGDSVNRPIKVLIQMDKKDQYGIKYRDTFWFVRYNRLILVKKEVKGFKIL